MSSASEAHLSAVSNHAARYSIEFIVDDKKKLLRDGANVRHVQELFSVVCQTQREWVTIGGSSQESVEKAKNYVLAMCCPDVHSDLSCGKTGHGCRLAGLLFNHRSNLHTNLERNFLTYIQHLSSQEGLSFIRVQGKEHHVIETMSQLRSMVETIESEHQPSPPPPSFSPPLYLPGSGDKESRSHSQQQAPVADNSSVDAELVRAIAMLSPNDKQMLLSQTYQDRSSSKDPPLLMSRTPVEPMMQKKRDYYVQALGFPADKVEATLESLGPWATDNAILERLNNYKFVVNSPTVPPSMVKPASVGEYVPRPVLEEAVGVSHVTNQVAGSKLRPIVIDGSNVAMRHGNGQIFSCHGIQLVVDYFKSRGHNHIKVFVPEWRKESSRPETPISDQYILEALDKERILVYTPSRKINGRRVVCYDDRFIVKYAHAEGGVIVSNDQYRDLMQENSDWRRVIEQHLLQFTFANDHFMPPDDPLGKSGPTLDAFLCKDPMELVPKKASSDVRGSSMPICPHLGNCTFGKKCRYYHPDREPQKTEHVVGSGSSGGSYTPSTSSRSATPSPSPDNRSQGLHSSKNSREDLYGQLSHHSSSDDLQRGERERVLGEELASGIDISDLTERLMQTSIGQTSPSKAATYVESYPHTQGPISHLSIKFLSTPCHVKSAPTLEDTPSMLPPPPQLVDGIRPQNHTFPIAQVPQVRNVRSVNVTEDHSYHVQTHVHLNQHSFEDTANFAPHEGGVVPGNYQSLVPRDVRQGPQYLPNPHYVSSRGVGAGQGAGMYPQGSDYGGMIDPAHMRRDLQAQHSSQPAGVRYGGRTRVGSGYPSHQQIMVSYDQHRGTSADQSIPLRHNLHHQHFSPNHQPHPHHGYGHASHSPAQQGHYNSSHSPMPMGPQQGHYNSPQFPQGRYELYRTALAVLPGCEDRIMKVMQSHPELVSESQIQALVNLIVE